MSKVKLDESNRNRPTEVRIKIRIPKKYHQEPIISELGNRYSLQVNIFSAVLGANAEGDGWFDLLLSGNSEAIDSALIYLSDLDVEIWNKSSTLQDGW